MRQLSSTTVAHVEGHAEWTATAGLRLTWRPRPPPSPQPRDPLREALARRAEANAAILKLEQALLVAGSAQAEAQTRHDAATGQRRRRTAERRTPRRQLLHWH
jgi:hypothetical protein